MDKANKLPKQIIRIILYSLGLGSLSAVIYLAGPLVAFGDWHPLENHAVRSIIILLLVTAAAGFSGFGLFQRRKAANQIADGISGGEQTVNDEPVLKERMRPAISPAGPWSNRSTPSESPKLHSIWWSNARPRFFTPTSRSWI